jgi:23S rRNA pseudouridine2604 synthase
MVTLTLKKKSAPSPDQGKPAGRGPLRGQGSRPRPTLAEAQAQRIEQQQAWDRENAQQQRDERRPQPPRRDGGGPLSVNNQRFAQNLADRGGPPRRDAPPPRPQQGWERDAPPPRDDRRPPAPRRDGGGPLSVNNQRFAQNLADRGGPRREAPAPQQWQQPPEAPRPAPTTRPLKSVVNPQVARQMGSDRPGMPPATPTHRPPGLPSAEGDRLSKRMTALGLSSRREADEWIEAGWVRVNGRLAVLGQRVRPEDKIVVDPAAHREQAQRVTILLNKPIGYVSGQAEDGYEPASVLLRPENQWTEDQSGLRWHPGHMRSLAPAGRLDIDSVGLLVLTQDGRVARQLIGEDSNIEKEYLVRVEYHHGPRLPDADLALLNHGLTLDDHVLRPCKVSWQNEDQLRFVLREGRKRQIRRMCEAVGLKVVGLKRVRIGSVNLGHLPPGQWRYLRRDEFFA